tara:strand:- start:300 stop:530 length:231 start_codon:yes stop_codon:yes gene_type:complete
MDGKQLMYDALRTQCKAEKAEAEFTLNNYMMNSVGIGEHPQQVEEAMSALDKLASANDKLENLKSFMEKSKSYGVR